MKPIVFGGRGALVVLAAFTLSISAAPALAAAAPNGAAGATRESAEPGLAPADPANAVYLDLNGQVISEPGGLPVGEDADRVAGVRPDSAEPAAIGCTPESGRDNPHYSGGDVSGHGWWKKGNCTANTAHVYNCLYEYYTDATWRQKACSEKKKLKPYTGSGQRTVARARCNSTDRPISWRNHVDVDVDGQIDTPEKPMNQANVRCVVN
ncbi:hypothetical protein [Saccharothrix obliqua]|uniref:hypothetical protein n=1 Tax=Saccharothrix obliqua TaxID=2861747 RepID=UPI001C5FA6A9|nr:hypothetical protein [Saccharothrix obliqua]MBW4716758.1 hypothetical protein [Saccharothrix obliqua]